MLVCSGWSKVTRGVSAGSDPSLHSLADLTEGLAQVGLLGECTQRLNPAATPLATTLKFTAARGFPATGKQAPKPSCKDTASNQVNHCADSSMLVQVH